MSQVKSSFYIRLEQSKCFQFLGITVTQENTLVKIDQNKFAESLVITPLSTAGRDVTDSLDDEEFKIFQGNVGKPCGCAIKHALISVLTRVCLAVH